MHAWTHRQANSGEVVRAGGSVHHSLPQSDCTAVLAGLTSLATAAAAEPSDIDLWFHASLLPRSCRPDHACLWLTWLAYMYLTEPSLPT